jgi:hypothetical protein
VVNLQKKVIAGVFVSGVAPFRQPGDPTGSLLMVLSSQEMTSLRFPLVESFFFQL